MNRPHHRLLGLTALLAATLLVGAAPVAAAGPTGQFPLKGSLANTAGTSIGLTPLGNPTFESVTGANGSPRQALGVDAGEGVELGVVGKAARGTYAIEVQFQLDDVTGYHRILSFGPNTTDTGLYVHDGNIVLYPGKESIADFPMEAGDWVTVRVTRNSATGKMQVYWTSPTAFWVFTRKDTAKAFKLKGGVADLFQDDNGEDGSGYLGRITIWNSYKPVKIGID